MDRVEAKMSGDAERGGVGNMPKVNLDTDMDHSLGNDLGGKFSE